MAQNLVIVESPAKAKTIAKFLGDKYKVIASNGHVRDLPKSQLGVDVEHDFAPKYITLRGRGDVLERIRKESKNAESIYLATDPDREGEAISWHLAQVLKLDERSNCRIVFNEITSGAVKSSITHARAIDMNLVDAQQARRVLDRLVGYKISPVLWAKVRKGLSAGRVQSVATRIICDRENEINAFVPEEFWVITAKLSGQGGFEAKFYGFDGKKQDLHTEAEAMDVVERSSHAEFIVSDVKRTEKTRHAPAPFTTSTMQQEASRRLSFTTKNTMAVAQQLYEGVELMGRGTMGLISYIRTDSVRIAGEAQDAAREYIVKHYGEQYVPQKPNTYKGRRGAQDAHEAIRPTDIALSPDSISSSLNVSQYRLYKLIYERFLASQMSEQRYESTAVTLDAVGCTFKANGVKNLFDGYAAIYADSRENEEKDVVLPSIEKGDCFAASAVIPAQHFTQPPLRYTEGTLVKALEEKGIGRPSTYLPTISTISDRGYVSREKKYLVPTELGFVVTNIMKENFSDIVDVRFTADLEDKLDDVEGGDTAWTKVVSDFYGPFIATVEKASQELEHVKIPDEVSDVPCEKCGAMMVYKVSRYGKFLACPNYPECKNTKAIIDVVDVPCPKCGSKVIKLKTKKGKPFYGCEKYPECDFVSWDRPAKEKCPKCGSLMFQKIGKRGGYTICSNPDCKHVLRRLKKDAPDAKGAAENGNE